MPDADRAFYSKGTYDIEYEFPFGKQELEGVAYRTDYDLTQHQKASGKSLDYFDEETKARFIPHVIEPSAGVDRTVLALICEAYDEETVTDEKGKSETRIVLRFHPRIAPVKAGIFPLLKNQPPLVEKAREVQALLRPLMNVFYDETGAIGRRYRRQDEAGTPFGITIDFETLGERDPALRDTVTLRHRDSMEQERVKISELAGEARERDCLVNLEDFRDYCLTKAGATEGTPFGEDTIVFKVARQDFRPRFARRSAAARESEMRPGPRARFARSLRGSAARLSHEQEALEHGRARRPNPGR